MCIHGDKSQPERDWVLVEFRSGKAPILVATDVASRGLDVEDIKFVINYDYPNSSEDYVHRIGRTARSSNKGTAYTFFTPGNLRQARDLVRVLAEARQAINPKLLQFVESGRGGGGGGGRMRYRGSSSNNSNHMFQRQNDRSMHAGGGGGGGGSKDSRSSFGRDSHNNHDGGRSTSSFRDRGRDQKNSHSAGSDQYQSYSSGGGGGFNSRNGGQDKSSQPQGQFSQPLPPPSLSGGLQPLMTHQFAAQQQALMGFVGQPPYPFASPPPPPPGPPPPRK